MNQLKGLEMKKIKTRVIEFLRDEEGASGIEYALIAAMVAVVIAAFVPQISGPIKTIFETIRDKLSTSSTT